MRKRPRPLVRVENGRKVLRIGGYLQSVEVNHRHRPDIWDAMADTTRRPRAVLILGLGGGTIARILTKRFGAIPITAVEYDPAVVRVAREQFGVSRLTHVRILTTDAFAFVKLPSGPYDLVCVDLYQTDRIPRGTLGLAFLRALRQLLARRGTVTFNLYPPRRVSAQLRRLAKVLRVRDTIRVDENVVAYCSRGG